MPSSGLVASSRTRAAVRAATPGPCRTSRRAARRPGDRLLDSAAERPGPDEHHHRDQHPEERAPTSASGVTCPRPAAGVAQYRVGSASRAEAGKGASDKLSSANRSPLRASSSSLSVMTPPLVERPRPRHGARKNKGPALITRRRTRPAADHETETAEPVAPGPGDGETAGMTEDPYLWLEDVTGERSLDWVRARNDESTGELTGSERFGELRDEIREVLDADDRIPYIRRRGEYLYNFWQDAAHPRGLWRRTTLEGTAPTNPPGSCCSTSTRSPRPRVRTGCGRARWSCARATGAAWSSCPVAARTRPWCANSTSTSTGSSKAGSRCPRPRAPSAGSTSTASMWARTSARAR